MPILGVGETEIEHVSPVNSQCFDTNMSKNMRACKAMYNPPKPKHMSKKRHARFIKMPGSWIGGWRAVYLLCQMKFLVESHFSAFVYLQKEKSYTSATCTKEHLDRKKHKEKDIHISHTTPQTRLQRLRIPPEQPHHARPTQRGENRPAVVLDEFKLVLVQA